MTKWQDGLQDWLDEYQPGGYTELKDGTRVCYRAWYTTSARYKITRVSVRRDGAWMVECSHGKWLTFEKPKMPPDFYMGYNIDKPGMFTPAVMGRLRRQVIAAFRVMNRKPPKRLFQLLGDLAEDDKHHTHYEPAQEEIKAMFNVDAKTVLALQSQKGVRTVKVKFNREAEKLNDKFNDEDSGFSHGEYTYKTTHDHKVGDTVLVEARQWFKVAKVTEVHDVADMSGDIEKYRWVLAVVNDAVELSKKLQQAESDLDRNLANARAVKEAREMMKEAGVDELDDLVRVPTMADVEGSAEHAKAIAAGNETGAPLEYTEREGLE